MELLIFVVGALLITNAWAVGHIAEHESYHLGKCTLLRSLLQARVGPGGERETS